MHLWSRAVWLENGQEIEDVIPTSWIKGKELKWPRVSLSVAVRAMKEKWVPEDTWQSFEMIKTKITSDDKTECEEFNNTTAIDTDDNGDNEETVTQKRVHKKKSFGSDFATDTSPEKHKEKQSKKLPPPPPTLNMEVISVDVHSPRSPSSDSNVSRYTTYSRSPVHQSTPHSPESSRSTSLFRSSKSRSRSRSRQSRSQSRSSHHSLSQNYGSTQERHNNKSREDTSRREPERSRSRHDASRLERSRHDTSRLERSRHDTSRREHSRFERSRSRHDASRQERSRPQTSRQERSPSERPRSRHDTSRREPSRSERSSSRHDISRQERGSSRHITSRKEPSRSQRSRSRHDTPGQEPLRSERSHSHHDTAIQERPSHNNRPRQERSRSVSHHDNSRIPSGYPMPEERFQRRVIYLLSEMRDMLKKGRGVNDSHEPIEPMVQCTSLDEFKNFDRSLKDQSDVCRSQIQRIGGSDFGDLIKKVMSRCMTNKVMAQMNFGGTKKKFAFGGSAFYKLMRDIVMGLHNATETQVQDKASNYLKWAPERKNGGGRKKTSE